MEIEPSSNSKIDATKNKPFILFDDHDKLWYFRVMRKFKNIK